MNPLELERDPDADEEIGLGAEEGGEGGEGKRGEGGAEGGAEEEGDLGEYEGEPDAEEGTGLEVEGVDDVGDHEA